MPSGILANNLSPFANQLDLLMNLTCFARQFNLFCQRKQVKFIDKTSYFEKWVKIALKALLISIETRTQILLKQDHGFYRIGSTASTETRKEQRQRPIKRGTCLAASPPHISVKYKMESNQIFVMIPFSAVRKNSTIMEISWPPGICSIIWFMASNTLVWPWNTKR